MEATFGDYVGRQDSKAGFHNRVLIWGSFCFQDGVLFVSEAGSLPSFPYSYFIVCFVSSLRKNSFFFGLFQGRVLISLSGLLGGVIFFLNVGFLSNWIFVFSWLVLFIFNCFLLFSFYLLFEGIILFFFSVILNSLHRFVHLFFSYYFS